jgi:NAD(P) transhydrogenase subunit alpha
VDPGAGEAAHLPDEQYTEAGAKVEPGSGFSGEVVAKVQPPSAEEIGRLSQDSVLIGFLQPLTNGDTAKALADAGVTSFAMEAIPRITRAQSMDALSSQATVGGYRAALITAQELGRFFPMLTTAAGTIRPAKVLVLGAGVAGLQAIATARRMGGIVTATDVRPAAKEQVESLGAKFVAVEDEEFRQAETAGGYAKEMSKEYQAKQAELVSSHIAKQDIVITTALIPGRPAPKLVSRAMVESMKPGSVIVDLAVERGGNCEAAKPGEVAEHNGVKIVGHLNVPGRLAATASSLYARNLYAFVETLVDKSTKQLAVKWDDELVKATCLTRDGAIVHTAFQPKA